MGNNAKQNRRKSLSVKEWEVVGAQPTHGPKHTCSVLEMFQEISRASRKVWT